MLVQNLKPGALSKLGFPPERLAAINPRLISRSISGYGENGPYAERKAYDLLIQAESGLSSVTGGPEAPARVGVSIVDIAAGHNAYEAILEALIGRSRTGAGTDIRISMFDAAADWLTVPLLQFEGGRPPQRLGLADPSIAPYGVFRSREGQEILISIQSDREWRALCQSLLGGRSSPRTRALPPISPANRRETDEAVAAAFAALPTREIAERLLAADLAFGELNDMAGLGETPASRPHPRRHALRAGLLSRAAAAARCLRPGAAARASTRRLCARSSSGPRRGPDP